MSNTLIQWHHIDSQESFDEQVPPQLEAPDTGEPPSNAKRPPHQYRLYELIVGFALLYGVAMFIIWQIGERRLSLLESEVNSLQDELVEVKSQASEQSPFPEIDSGKSDNPSLAYRLEKEFLIFEASERAAYTVGVIAGRSNISYQQLHRSFGLGPVSNLPKLKIVVDPVKPMVDENENSIIVPSPEEAADLFGYSKADILAFTIFAEMSLQILQKAKEQREIKPQWHTFADSLAHYLQRENGLNPDWRQNDEYIRRRQLAQGYTLAQGPNENTEPQGRTGLWVQPNSIAYEFADPLIEFIIETYGDDQLPLLFDAFEEHESWDTLIPAVFDVSATNFEAQWHAYLASKYPR